MKKDKIGEMDIVFVLDKSSSVRYNEEKICKKFNDTIKFFRQKDIDVFVTLVKFNETQEIVYCREAIEKVQELNFKEYHTSGTTAYYDVLVETMKKVRKITNTIDGNHPVLFIVVSDEFDNSSSKKNTTGKNDTYCKQHYFEKIKEYQEERYNWKFRFTKLGKAYFLKDSLKYDAIEQTEEYKKVVDEVDKEVSLKIRSSKELGYYYKFWKEKQQLLLNKYKIEWITPDVMNPELLFY